MAQTKSRVCILRSAAPREPLCAFSSEQHNLKSENKIGGKIQDIFFSLLAAPFAALCCKRQRKWGGT